MEEEIEKYHQKTEVLSSSDSDQTRAQKMISTVQNEALDVPNKLSKFELNRTTDELRSEVIFGTAH